jgi:flagellar basal-body rod modification protein FlgD
MSITALQNNGNTQAVTDAATSAKEQSDRFMKLLVAQMQNQDPLNPMDNAQVSTVSGIETLNTTVTGLNSQFTQLQALQSAALIGRDVAVEGDILRIQDGVGDGGFELGSAATSATVTIKNAAGATVGTVELTDLDAGRHSFTFDVPDSYESSELSFSVEAKNGDTTVEAMTLAHQRVKAVSNFGDTLALELASGERISYDAVWAVL